MSGFGVGGGGAARRDVWACPGSAARGHAASRRYREDVNAATSTMARTPRRSYSALFDAYVAYRHGSLTKADFCAFQSDDRAHYRARAASGPRCTERVGEYFNAQRAKALSWRAPVDPTLRGG